MSESDGPCTYAICAHLERGVAELTHLVATTLP